MTMYSYDLRKLKFNMGGFRILLRGGGCDNSISFLLKLHLYVAFHVSSVYFIFRLSVNILPSQVLIC